MPPLGTRWVAGADCRPRALPTRVSCACIAGVGHVDREPCGARFAAPAAAKAATCAAMSCCGCVTITGDIARPPHGESGSGECECGPGECECAEGDLPNDGLGNRPGASITWPGCPRTICPGTGDKRRAGAAPGPRFTCSATGWPMGAAGIGAVLPTAKLAGALVANAIWAGGCLVCCCSRAGLARASAVLLANFSASGVNCLVRAPPRPRSSQDGGTVVTRSGNGGTLKAALAAAAKLGCVNWLMAPPSAGCPIAATGGERPPASGRGSGMGCWST